MKNRKSWKISAGFRPETRFAWEQVSVARRPSGRIAVLEELKERLLQEQARAASNADAWSCLRRAADDAASLAWATPCPLLVLPELFAEKAAEARWRRQRQLEILERSQGIVAQAV